MDKKLIVANWKSHKTSQEAIQFLNEFKEGLQTLDLTSKEIIILPQFTAIPACFDFIKENNLPISLGAQTVSSFEEGPYTGEVSASQIKPFCKYVLLNHSERRKYYKEGDEELKMKFEEAKKVDIFPIVCLQGTDSYFPEGAEIIVYEPPSAISTFGIGKPETKEDVSVATKALSEKSKGQILYGGSVSSNDISEYLGIEGLSGFLVGAASLDASSFLSLLNKC